MLESNKINIADTKQVDDIYKYYKETYWSEQGWVLIDSDNIKKLFTDFNKTAPELVHKPSSQLSQAFYEKALKENPTQRVILMAWGGWSWKSEWLLNVINKEWPAIIFDWTGKNFDKQIKNYELALAQWKNPEIQGVWVDFRKAVEFNNARERVVPLDILEDTHAWFRETTLRILEERPDINVSLVKNAGLMIEETWDFIFFKIPKERQIEFMKNNQTLEY